MILAQEPDLLIEKDAHGIVRELRHLQTPAVAEPKQSAKQAALAYLKMAALERGLLPLDKRDWEHLRDTIDADGPARSAQARFRWVAPRELTRNSATETTIVWCQQTAPLDKTPDFIPDALGASIRLVVHHRKQTPQVTSARLTTRSSSSGSIGLVR